MKVYKLTASTSNGEKLIEESFEAETDEKAKEVWNTFQTFLIDLPALLYNIHFS
jgi:hypothetical protein